MGYSRTLWNVQELYGIFKKLMEYPRTLWNIPELKLERSRNFLKGYINEPRSHHTLQL